MAAHLGIDEPDHWTELGAAIQKKPASPKRKPLDYPDETHGSRLAAKARRVGNSLTAEERRGYFNQAMAIIYAGNRAKEIPAP